MADIGQILDKIDRLPALPSSVVRVIDMLTSGATDLGEIEQIVRHDEALSMVILGHANSARFGRPGRMFDLKQSIVRLGGKVLMKIVLEQQASAVFVSAGAAYGLRRGAMWRGALGGALAADEIARTHDFADKDLCFLCGLAPARTTARARAVAPRPRRTPARATTSARARAAASPATTAAAARTTARASAAAPSRSRNRTARRAPA